LTNGVLVGSISQLNSKCCESLDLSPGCELPSESTSSTCNLLQVASFQVLWLMGVVAPFTVFVYSVLLIERVCKRDVGVLPMLMILWSAILTLLVATLVFVAEYNLKGILMQNYIRLRNSCASTTSQQLTGNTDCDEANSAFIQMNAVFFILSSIFCLAVIFHRQYCRSRRFQRRLSDLQESLLNGLQDCSPHQVLGPFQENAASPPSQPTSEPSLAPALDQISEQTENLHSEQILNQSPSYTTIQANESSSQNTEVGLNQGPPSPSADPSCRFCCDNLRSVVFQPCGHYCACEQCAPRFETCPYCSREITSRQRIFEC
jgi:hypothetical protein